MSRVLEALLEPAPNVKKQDAALPVSRALYAVWVALLIYKLALTLKHIRVGQGLLAGG